jgi:hypothetical protein
MSKWGDIINEAFEDLGVIQPGEIISPTMQASAFLVFQQMYSSWAAEQTMAYLTVHKGFPLSPGTVAYTLGAGGSLNAGVRVVRVTGWTASSGGFRNGGSILSLEAIHAQAKDVIGRTSILPEAVGCDGAFPLINLEVFPAPAANPGTLELDYYTPLIAPVNVADDITLPEGWEEALHFNLAIALSPQYARVGGVPPALMANAQNSKAVIVQRNAAILGLQPQQPGPQSQPGQ